MSDDPAPNGQDPCLPEGGLTQLSDGELWDLMDASSGGATDRSNNTPAGETVAGGEDIRRYLRLHGVSTKRQPAITEFFDQATATGPPLIPPDGGSVLTAGPKRSPPTKKTPTTFEPATTTLGRTTEHSTQNSITSAGRGVHY